MLRSIVTCCGSRPAGELLFYWFYQVILPTWLTILNLSGEFRLLRRVTFFQQLKKVTKKSRPFPIAPREAFGVPEFTAIAYEPVLMRRPGAQD